MKRFIFALAAACLLIGSCGTPRMTPQEKKLQQARITSQVNSILDSRSFKINVDYMNPLRGGGRAITFGYCVKVDGEKLVSYLPYVGDARNIPYDGGSGLNFESTISEYQDSGFKKDRRTITLSTSIDGDLLDYTIIVFDNTKADIRVHSRNRDDISYIGYLQLTKDE